jgi:mannosyltransferase
MPAFRRIAASPHLVALAGVVLLGALLRFATLDLQSYRYDEAVTVVRVLHPSLSSTLTAVPHSESTPPLYYLVAWIWSRPFGTGEVWMRSLSALAGTASIIVVYLCAVALPLPRRAGLIAAAAVAVSPVLIWFSQDARAYALVFLLTALSFLFFARARRRGARGDFAWWAVLSALAIATHYFAGFVVAAEAVLLLVSAGNRRRVLVAAFAIVAAVALLLPVAMRQSSNAHAGWISQQPLDQRLERAGAKLLGADNGDEHGARPSGPIPLGVPLALALVAVALLLWRGDREERRGAGVAALVGSLAVAMPLLLGRLGVDYFDGRNMLPMFVPLLIVLGAGFGVLRAGRVGIALAAAFCLCSLAFSLEIDRLPRLQREDLRKAAAEVGRLGPATAVLTSRYAGSQPLRYYLRAQLAEGALPPLREIDLVGSAGAADRNARRLLPPAFRRVESKPVSYEFTLTRFRSRLPVRVPLDLLQRGALVGGGRSASVLIAPSASAAQAAVR